MVVYVGKHRDKINRYLERIENSDEISEDDREIMLQFSDRLELMRSEIGELRHKTLLARCFMMAREVGGLADSLEDRKAAEELVRWIHRTYDNENTNHSYRNALRSFGRRATDGDEHPESIEWIPSGMSSSHNPVPDPSDMMTWDEDVVPMIEAARNSRDAALIAISFDSGARSGEIRDLTVGDVTDHKHGLQIRVDGKTGQRSVTLIPSVPYLNKWLADHPDPDDPNAPLWSKLNSAEEITYQRASQALKSAAKAAGVNKTVTFTNFRKSNASYLARMGLGQAYIEDRQGRKRGSDATAHYIARFGGEAENDFARMHGLDIEEEEPEPIGPVMCPRCDKETPRHKPICVWCSQALDHTALENIDEDSRETRNALLRFAQSNPELLKELKSARDFAEIVDNNPELVDEAEDFIAALDQP